MIHKQYVVDYLIIRRWLLQALPRQNICNFLFYKKYLYFLDHISWREEQNVSVICLSCYSPPFFRGFQVLFLIPHQSNVEDEGG